MRRYPLLSLPRPAWTGHSWLRFRDGHEVSLYLERECPGSPRRTGLNRRLRLDTLSRGVSDLCGLRYSDTSPLRPVGSVKVSPAVASSALGAALVAELSTAGRRGLLLVARGRPVRAVVAEMPRIASSPASIRAIHLPPPLNGTVSRFADQGIARALSVLLVALRCSRDPFLFSTDTRPEICARLKGQCSGKVVCRFGRLPRFIE